MSGPLMKMMKAMDNTIRVMERMDSAASNVDTRGLQRARRDIQSATADMERLRSSSNAPDRLSDGFRRMEGPVNRAGSAVRNFFATFAGAAAAILSLQGLTNGFKKFVEASDAYTSTSARLANINDGLQTQAELQDKIYYAAQRSLTPYNDMANSIAKLNLLAADAFSSNDEAIRFSELMGKSFAISGASTQEKQAGTYQLTQAMAAGKLQGDEFRSITENAPMLAKAISESMGVSMGALKELSSEGAITADIIKESLFKAADDIESKFDSMPLTFADAMTKMKNWSGTAFEPLFVRFSEFVNSDAFGVLAGHATVFINVVVAGMTFMFDVIESVYTGIGAIGSLISASWDLVGPVIVAAGAALAAITAILIVKYMWLGLVRTATMAWAAAVWLVNKAFLANPIVRVLVIVITLIALLVQAMIEAADQVAAVFGAIVGSVYWLGAAATNVLMGIGNFAIMAWEWIVNSWNQAVYLVQVGWLVLNVMVHMVLEAIVNAVLVAAEWVINTWNQAMYNAQLAWIGLNLMARMVLDAIGNAAIKAAEWFVNTWNNGVFGVQTAFHKMASFVLTIMSGVASGVVGTVNTALGAISDLINGAVNGINSFIGLLNGVLGTDLSTVGTVDLKMGNGVSKFIDNIKSDLGAPVRAEKANFGRMDTAGDYMSGITMPTAPQKVNLGKMDTAAKNIEMPSAPVKKTFDRLEYTSLGDAYDRGNAAGTALSLKASEKLSGVIDKVAGVFKGPEDGKKNPFDTLEGMGDLANSPGAKSPLNDDKKKKNPTGGKLDKVGKIEKDINIAEEDIKMLRDLAEIKSIQNFVTLTPSVTFGDTTVKEEADIGKIMKKIENYFEGEMKNSVDGVYT